MAVIPPAAIPESGACVFLDLALAATTTPSGDPTLKPGLDPASVTPGTLGFLATLFVVVIVVFLIRDMVKRIRRVRYAAEVEQARVERAAAGGAARSGADDADLRGPQDGSGPGGTDGVGRPLPGGKHGPDNR
ncbi:hypothetical protein [Arthrobacter ruber]|uniref:hypothetical protein n=1 Tax=Arthrobacter ruber TaxID=1258893 RepID=UPI0030B84A75